MCKERFGSGWGRQAPLGGHQCTLVLAYGVCFAERSSEPEGGLGLHKADVDPRRRETLRRADRPPHRRCPDGQSEELVKALA